MKIWGIRALCIIGIAFCLFMIVGFGVGIDIRYTKWKIDYIQENYNVKK